MKEPLNYIEKSIHLKRTAIYARVSSQIQKDEETIDSQIDAIKDYAKSNNYSIEDKFIFVDNGVSGSKLQRPALDEFREVIRFETIETVLIYAPDRLSRNYTHQLILMEEFRKNGVKVCFLKNPPTNNTPEEKMLQHFQGIFAEYERTLFLDRSRRGRIYKAKKGDPSIIPSVPYGYRKVKQSNQTHIVVVDEEAQIVRNIFRLYIHEIGTLNGVARAITESGIKPRKGGSRWDMATIRDIIKNPTYLGVAHFGKTEVCEGQSDKIRKHGNKTFIKAKCARKKRPEEEWIPITVPQIISESDFEIAQEILKKNKARSPRNTITPGLLQGLMVCGICGQPYYKRTEKNGVKTRGYYYCRGNSLAKYKKCENKSLRQESVDEQVFNEVLQLLKTPSLIKQELERRAQEFSNCNELEQHEIVIKKELSKVSDECDRLLDAYQSGVIELKELKKRNIALGTRKKALEKEIQSIQAQRLNLNSGVEIEEIFDVILENIQTKGYCLTFDEKRKLVRLLVEQVIVSEDSVRIVHCISPYAIAGENCLLKANGGW